MSKAKRQSRERLGRWAEFLAANYLRLKGYKILEQRFKTKAGEVDLIAFKQGILVMVEVKARQNLTLAREAVTPSSQRRIERAAQIFIGRKSVYQRMGLRFDAVYLIGRFRIIHEPDLWG